jgi:arginine decarboxylase
MGDLHNLFGRVNEVHVFLEDDEPNGYYIEDTLAGIRMNEVIETVQYQWEELCRRIKTQIDAATKKDLVKPREGVRLLEFYEGQMLAKTYLNIDRSASTPEETRSQKTARTSRLPSGKPSTRRPRPSAKG